MDEREITGSLLGDRDRLHRIPTDSNGNEIALNEIGFSRLATAETSDCITWDIAFLISQPPFLTVNYHHYHRQRLLKGIPCCPLRLQYEVPATESHMFCCCRVNLELSLRMTTNCSPIVKAYSDWASISASAFFVVVNSGRNWSNANA